jgi:hypothetical protein
MVKSEIFYILVLVKESDTNRISGTKYGT